MRRIIRFKNIRCLLMKQTIRRMDILLHNIKIRRFFALICVVVIIFTIPANAEGKLRVKTDGLYISLLTEPIIKDENVMISVKDIGKILKANAVWDQVTKTVIIRKSEVKLKINISTNEVSLNNELTDIKLNAYIENNNVYLPLDVICKILDIKFSWDKKANIISINTGSDFLALDTNSFIDDGATFLTYKDAVNKAIIVNNSLKNLDDKVELIEKTMENIKYSYNNASYIPYKDLIGLVRQMDSLENSLSTITLSKELNEDITEFLIFNKVTSIESLKLDIKLLEESIALDDVNISNMELKNKLGLISDNEVKTAKLNLDLNKANLELLYVSLDSENQMLNNIMKKNLKDKTVVLYKPDFTTFKVTNIDGYIEQKIKSSPSIKMLEISLSQAEYKKNTSSYSIDETGIDLISSENEYKSAERDLSDSKLDLEKTIRSLFNNLKQLEGKQKTLELDLEKAINNYNNAVTSYEAGNAIMYQIEQARLGILKVEVDIQKNRISYDMLKFNLEKPYLASQSGQ